MLVALVVLVIALVAVVLAALWSLNRALGFAYSERQSVLELTQASVREMSQLHSESMRAAFDATKSAAESWASTMRAPAHLLPDGGLAQPGDELMMPFEIPDHLPDWTDTLIPGPQRPDVAFLVDGFDPGAEIGL